MQVRHFKSFANEKSIEISATRRTRDQQQVIPWVTAQPEIEWRISWRGWWKCTRSFIKYVRVKCIWCFIHWWTSMRLFSTITIHRSYNSIIYIFLFDAVSASRAVIGRCQCSARELKICGKNISDTLACGSCATFLFLPHFDVICAWSVFEQKRQHGIWLLKIYQANITWVLISRIFLLWMGAPLLNRTILIFHTAHY